MAASADALVLTGPRALERRSFDIPEIGDDDGLLRVEACGLCGTDHELYTGHIRTPGAIVPGHEVVGVVERVGAQAAERWGVREGQRVAVEVFLSCRECANCRFPRATRPASARLRMRTSCLAGWTARPP